MFNGSKTKTIILPKEEGRKKTPYTKPLLPRNKNEVLVFQGIELLENGDRDFQRIVKNEMSKREIENLHDTDNITRTAIFKIALDTYKRKY
jgi:hypothetical protein